MKRNPLVPIICRAKRFVRNFKPEIRVKTVGEIGVYPDKGAEKPVASLKLNRDYAVPLLKAVAVILAIVAIVKLLDD